MRTARLNEQEKNLLISCLKKYKPDMVDKINKLGSNLISKEEINEIRDIMGNELQANGFNSDWEPNEYGLKLEDLIGKLGDLYLWPDKKQL